MELILAAILLAGFIAFVAYRNAKRVAGGSGNGGEIGSGNGSHDSNHKEEI